MTAIVARDALNARVEAGIVPVTMDGPRFEAAESKQHLESLPTVAGDFFDGLDFWRRQKPRSVIRPWLVYGGDAAQTRESGTVVPWQKIGTMLEAL